ncbi:MAG TPA: xanthine dehydrogenase family protein subunit M [Burkholderiales bacterium]|nr:xanthine dehydrogenase family protein subunit M [Burkholderiales bacterium]
MHAFNYHKASSVADATAKLAASDDGRLLAGGQTLIAAMKMRLSAPSDLVDLAGIAELRGIKVDASSATVGAMTTHATVAASPEIKKAIPALALLASEIGDPMVRNMGTMGGSVANNDPAADYPAAVLGLGATVLTSKRKIPADKFFTAMYETALEPGEIITSIAFPVPKRAGYSKFKNPASRYALVGVFVADTANGIRVAVTGAGPCVFRLPELEKALGKSFSPDAVNGIKVPATNLNADIHASAEYRAHLITVMAKRAVSQILSK